MRHMLSKFRGAFWSMKMKKKLCLIFAFTSISILLLNFVLYSHIYRQETMRNTTAVFQQTAQIYCGGLDHLLESVSNIARAPYYSKQLQRELGIGKVSDNNLDLLRYAIFSSGSDTDSVGCFFL